MWLLKIAKGIGGLFTGPTSNPEVIQKATEGVYNGLDKIFFTKEERQEASQKAMDTILKFQEVYANENSAQSKARRHLAYLITYYFLACCTAYIILKGLGWDASATKEVIAVLSTAFTAVVLTYFVPHQASKLFAIKSKK